MKLQEEVIKKIFGCYANKWHLATMLLPFLNKKIDESIIITVLGETIEYEIKELLNKIQINKELKDKIVNIGWTSKDEIDLNSIKQNNKEINIIITGTKNEIENKNEYIKLLIGTKIGKKPKINIINLYKIEEIRNINEILCKHNYIINTSGIHDIKEIYPQYNEKISS